MWVGYSNEENEKGDPTDTLYQGKGLVLEDADPLFSTVQAHWMEGNGDLDTNAVWNMHVKHCYPLEGEHPITRPQNLYIALADREENIVKITLDKLDSSEEEPRQADPHSATFVKEEEEEEFIKEILQ
jgi:hypothetical protein